MAFCTVTDVRNVFPVIKGDSNYPTATVARFVYRAQRRMRSWLGGATWGFTRSQMNGWETTRPSPIRDLCAELAAAFIQIDQLGLDVPNPEAPRTPAMATCQLTYLRIISDCKDLASRKAVVEDTSSNIIEPTGIIVMNKTTDDNVFIGNDDF